MRMPIQAQAVSRTALQADSRSIASPNGTTGVKASAVSVQQPAPILAPVQSLPIIRAGALGNTSGGIAASWWDSGFWKDQIEDIWRSFERAFGPVIDAVKNAANKVAEAFRGAGQTFVCGQWATTMLRCGTNGPLLSVAQMTADCIRAGGGTLGAAAACPALGAAMYPLAQAYCNEARGNPDGQAALMQRILQQVCPGR